MDNVVKRRNPWPIVITGYFIVFFAGLVAFIAFASGHREDLVRADYYEQEIRFQKQLDRVQRTRAIEQPVNVAYDAGQKCITIQLPLAHAAQTGGRIHLYRPSDARLDRDLDLVTDVAGKQRLDAATLRTGLWKVRVEWTVAGEEYFMDQAVVVKQAARS
jgi:hypothetical protein